MSFFSKDAVDKAIPTLYNVPVVGHLIQDEAGKLYMGGHDIEVELTEKGVQFKSLVVPYGVVPQQDSVSYETLREPSGEEVEYLCADVILWTGRWPELMEAAYGEDVYFNESMEISVDKWRYLEDDKNYLDVLDFTYSALCLLGKADDVTSKEYTEPCFPLSCVIPYSMNAATDEFAALMDQLKLELAFCFKQKIKEGGGEILLTDKQRDAILQEFNSTLEQVGVEVTPDMTEESFRAAVRAYADTAGEKQADDDTLSFSHSYRKKRCALEDALSPVYTRDDAGNMIAEVCHYVVDFDDTFVYVERYMYTATESKDDTGRYKYTMNDACTEATIDGEFETMVMRWLTLEEDAQIETQRGEYSELKAFKETRLQADRKAEINEVLSGFNDLVGNEEFAAIREKALSYESTDSLRTACFAVRGKVAAPTPGVAPASNRQPIAAGIGTESGGRYGHLFEKYGRK